MNKKWTKTEEEFLIKSASFLTDAQCAVQLSSISERNITLDSVRKKRQQLGIKKKPGRGICAVIEEEKV